MKKTKKRKEANEWPAKRVRILVRCVVEGSGVGGVTRVRSEERRVGKEC